MSEFDDIFNSPKKESEEISVQPFDKEEWAQQKKAEREHAYELIDQAAEFIAHDGSYVQAYLDLQSRFPRYSVGNILLIASQKPDSTKLADYKTWKEEGVFIKRGETGIVILEPGNEYTREDGSIAVSYNAKRVFDITQTTSKMPPEPEVHRDDRLLLKALIYNAPCEIKLDAPDEFPNNMAARYDSENHTIYVARGQKAPVLFREIARELARAHMDRDGYSGNTGMFTATCVSYLLCRRNNMEVDSFSFADLPESLSKLEPKEVRAELGKARDLFNTVSADMERLFERQKDVTCSISLLCSYPVYIKAV